MEIWKPIENYEDLYEVSNFGRIRRKDSYVKTGIKNSEERICKGRVLKQNLKRNGYLAVDLSKKQEVKTISVHRLVAKAFCEGETDERKYVNHKNANKQDNRAENLEWCTLEENKNHALENKLYKCTFKKRVRCKQTNKTFESSYQAAEYLNEHYFNNTKTVKHIAAKIRSCCLGLQKSAYGFTWETK